MAQAAVSRQGQLPLPAKYDTSHLLVGGSADGALRSMEDPVGEAVVLCVLSGDAIFLGATKDRSALIVRVYSEQGNGEWFVGTPEALQGVLQVIRDACR